MLGSTAPSIMTIISSMRKDDRMGDLDHVTKAAGSEGSAEHDVTSSNLRQHNSMHEEASGGGRWQQAGKEEGAGSVSEDSSGSSTAVSWCCGVWGGVGGGLGY